MGHTDPALALRVYRQAMRRGDDEKAALRALVEGGTVTVADRPGEGPQRSPCSDVTACEASGPCSAR